MPRRPWRRTTAKTANPRPASSAPTATAADKLAVTFVSVSSFWVVGKTSCGHPRGFGGRVPIGARTPAPNPQSELVSTLATENDPDRPPHDRQIERETPVVHVVQVETHRVVPREVGAARHLPQAGDAGADEQAAAYVAEEVAILGG